MECAIMARSMALIDREPLKLQEGTLENVAESTCRTIGKGSRFCRIKNEKKSLNSGSRRRYNKY
jgi:hypothetical protein